MMNTKADKDYIAQLRRTLWARFNEHEFRRLCSDLDIEYDGLPGVGRADKAKELVEYCRRHDRLSELIAAGKQLRPEIPWRDRPIVDAEDSGRNPYWHRGPIGDPAYFFGRTYEVRTALSLLAGLQSISLIGPRRIGKTSLLHYLSDPSVLKDHAIAPEQFVFIFMSCEMLSDLGRDRILQLMLEKAQAGVRQAGFQVDPGGPPVAGMTFFDFSRALERLTAFGANLVFLFDEFEYLAQNRSLEPAFFAGLRSIASNLSVAFITSSGRSLLDLTYADTSVLGSPFFNIFSTIRLGLFDDDDARDLISRPSRAAGVVFSDATTEYILSLADHHPFFLTIACFHAFEMQFQNGALTEADYPLLRERVENGLQSHLRYSWDRLGEEAQQLLLSSETAWKDPRHRNLLEFLNDQGVVVRRSDNQFQWCSLWADFVKSQRANEIGFATLEP